MKPIAISPVIIKVIPNPLRGAGTFEYAIFSRIAAIARIANNQPIPDPNPYMLDSRIPEKSLICIKSDPPRIAQFTAINGKNIPRAPYSAGEIFSTIISTNCTIDAITAINIIKLKKLKSNSAYSDPNHTRAPGCKMYLSIKKLSGTVMVKTKTTAKPIPIDVLTVLETAKYEHIPRK